MDDSSQQNNGAPPFGSALRLKQTHLTIAACTFDCTGYLAEHLTLCIIKQMGIHLARYAGIAVPQRFADFEHGNMQLIGCTGKRMPQTMKR